MFTMSTFSMDIDLSKVNVFEETVDMPLRFPIEKFKNPFCVADNTIGNTPNADIEVQMRSRTFKTFIAMGTVLKKITIAPSQYDQYPSPKYVRVTTDANHFYCEVKEQ